MSRGKEFGGREKVQGLMLRVEGRLGLGGWRGGAGEGGRGGERLRCCGLWRVVCGLWVVDWGLGFGVWGQVLTFSPS